MGSISGGGGTGLLIPAAGILVLALTGCEQPSDQTAPRWTDVRPAIPEMEVEKDAYDLSGDFRILEISKSRVGERLRRNVRVEMAKSGSFYLKAWAESPQGGEWSVYVDGEKAEGHVLQVPAGSWQFSELRKQGAVAALKLSTGTHTLSFESDGPVYPALERVWLSDEGMPQPSENRYAEYLARLQSPEPLLPARPLEKIAADNPLTQYQSGTRYASYTYTTTVWLTQNLNYSFKTDNLIPSNACDPAMYLFWDADPAVFSTMSNNGVNRNPSFSFTAPRTGNYRLLLAAETVAGKGTADIYMNNSKICTSCPVSGEYMPITSNSGNHANWFTAHWDHDPRYLSPDTRLFLIATFANGYNVRKHNDDYAGTGAYPWGRLSRIKGYMPTSIGSMLVSTYSSYTNPGYVYLFGDVATQPVSSDMSIFFPNLQADDAMRSSKALATYNCHAWAGGITSSWQEPYKAGTPWYVAGNPWASMDNYYGNRCAGSSARCYRYSGAWNYVRSGATENNAYLAVWVRTAKPNEITHSSVRSYANGPLHGYAYDSKLGQSERIFHPRDALVNESFYGHPHHYYTYGYLAKTGATGIGDPESAPERIDEETSVKRGLTVNEPKETLQDAHREKIAALKGRVKGFEGEFTGLYQGWKKQWTGSGMAFRSGLDAYKDLSAYDPLLRFSRASRAAAVAALAEKLEAGDFQARSLLEDLLLPASQAKLDDEVEAWKGRSVAIDGRVTVFSPENTWIRFAKRVLVEDL